MRLSLAIIVVALLGVLPDVAGCDRQAPAAKDVEPHAAGPSAAGGFGTIRGTVSLRGEPPIMREIPNQPCHRGATPILEETVVADEQGRLANVVVYLREGPSSATVSGPVELDQENCRYVPHVVALRTGQVLRVKTSDPAVHNVHATSTANPPRNVSMQPGEKPIDMTFAHPEQFTVRCDIHPWMNARVHVFEHHYFAVSSADGSFVLNDVPAGEYTLVFRHELFGDVAEVVTLADKQTLTKDTVYEKPQP
jgi:plastocyanin